MPVRQFQKTDNVHWSKSIVTRPAPTFLRGPVRAMNTAVPPPCVTLPARSMVAAPASLGGTGRLTPSFPLRAGGAMQPCGFVYHYEGSTSPARLVAAPAKKFA